MRIAYCGYDFFASTLAALVARGHELVELFSFQTDNEYDFNDKVLAQANAARARVTLSPLNQADLERLKAEQVDLLLCAAYPFKIPPWRDYVPYALNVHPSPLPEGRGVWPLPWIILKDLRESAVTVHEISERWDAGDIVAQERFPVDARETLEMLSIRSQLCAERLVPDTVDQLAERWAEKRPQGPGSYWPMPGKADRTISWDMTIDSIDRLVRAYSKFEPFLYIDGVRYFVRKVDVWPSDRHYDPGQLVHETNREKVYAAQDGLVCLTHFVRADEA